MPGGGRRGCARCCRDQVVELAAAAEGSLPSAVIDAAVQAAAPTGQALWRLAQVLAADPRRAAARGTADRGEAGRRADRPRLGRAGRSPLRALRPDREAADLPAMPGASASAAGPGSWPRPAAPAAGSSRWPCAAKPGNRCARCAGGTPAGPAGTAGPAARPRRSRSAAATASRMSASTATSCPKPSAPVCGRRRECNFAATSHPVCPSCSPRATATCARCGQDRPPQARWPDGPVCDPCYTAALKRRGRCASCGQQRRLVTPPGPHAGTCADCAASRSPAPAPTAGSRTSFMNAAGATGAACGAGSRCCWPGPTPGSRPGCCRSWRRSARPAPRNRR